MSRTEISFQDTKICLDQDTLGLEITSRGERWRVVDTYRPYFCVDGEEIRFDSAGKKEHFAWKTGVGTGIRSVFTGFSIGGKEDAMSFQTVIWIEYATQDVFFELTPLQEAEAIVGNFYWPGPMEFTGRRRDWYSLISLMQGLLIPNDWEYAVDRVTFDGQMCSAGSYMPWFGQVRPGASYIAIVGAVASKPGEAGVQTNCEVPLCNGRRLQRALQGLQSICKGEGTSGDAERKGGPKSAGGSVYRLRYRAYGNQKPRISRLRVL